MAFIKKALIQIGENIYILKQERIIFQMLQMPFPGHLFENVILKKFLKNDHFCPLNGFYSKSPHINWLKVIFP